MPAYARLSVEVQLQFRVDGVHESGPWLHAVDATRARATNFAPIRVQRRCRVLAGKHYGQDNEFTEGLALESIHKKYDSAKLGNKAKGDKREAQNQSRRTPGHYGGGPRGKTLVLSKEVEEIIARIPVGARNKRGHLRRVVAVFEELNELDALFQRIKPHSQERGSLAILRRRCKALRRAVDIHRKGEDTLMTDVELCKLNAAVRARGARAHPRYVDGLHADGPRAIRAPLRRRERPRRGHAR